MDHFTQKASPESSKPLASSHTTLINCACWLCCFPLCVCGGIFSTNLGSGLRFPHLVCVQHASLPFLPGETRFPCEWMRVCSSSTSLFRCAKVVGLQPIHEFSNVLFKKCDEEEAIGHVWGCHDHCYSYMFDSSQSLFPSPRVLIMFTVNIKEHNASRVYTRKFKSK